MMEVKSEATGKCETCETRSAVYTIDAAPDDFWSGPRRLCQPCLYGTAQKNQRLRFVLLFQAATSA
jgi:hypothetical protein